MATATEPSKRQWTRTEKILFWTLIAVSVPAIVGMLGIYDRIFGSSGPRLNVIGVHHGFSLPAITPSPWSPKDVPLPRLDEDPDLSEVDRQLLDKMAAFESTIQLSIKNEGDRPAKNVFVYLDRGGYAEVSKVETPTYRTFFEERLDLGDIAVEETVSLTIWSYASVTPKTLVAHDLGGQGVTYPQESQARRQIATFVICGAFLALWAHFLAWRARRFMQRAHEEVNERLVAKANDLLVAKKQLDERGDMIESALDALDAKYDRLREDLLKSTTNDDSSPSPATDTGEKTAASE